MVIAHFVGQQMKAEGRAEGLEEVLAEMEKWYQRLLEAHPESKDSIEPLPGTQTGNGGNREKPQEEH